MAPAVTLPPRLKMNSSPHYVRLPVSSLLALVASPCCQRRCLMDRRWCFLLQGLKVLKRIRLPFLSQWICFFKVFFFFYLSFLESSEVKHQTLNFKLFPSFRSRTDQNTTFPKKKKKSKRNPTLLLWCCFLWPAAFFSLNILYIYWYVSFQCFLQHKLEPAEFQKRNTFLWWYAPIDIFPCWM